MLIYWFLPMILFLGIVTSYEDIKYGKIRNKWILSALIYSLIVNAAFIFYNYAGYIYLSKFFINGLLSFALGFFMWFANFWTAGDAKLFFSYSQLLPLDIYKSYFQSFPSLSILVYAFVPLAAVLALMIVFKAAAKNKFRLFEKSFSLKDTLQSVLFIFAFLWVMEITFSYLDLKLDLALSLLILVILQRILRLAKLNMLLISSAISILRLIFDSSVFSAAFAVRFFIASLIFILLRFFLSIGLSAFTEKIKIGSLKAGMIPAGTGIFGKQYKKKVNRLLFGIKAKGLSAEDIAKLSKMARQSNIKHIEIQKAISFSPFLFASALIIIFLGIYV